MPLGFRERTLTEGVFQWLCMVPDFHSGSAALPRKQNPKKHLSRRFMEMQWILLVFGFPHISLRRVWCCVSAEGILDILGALTSFKRHINLNLPLGEGSPKDQSVDLALQPVRAGSVWCRTGCSVTKEGA